MAIPFVWKVDFKSGASWVTLPSVMAINIFKGRRLQIDDYSIDTMTVESEFPSSWTTTPKLGDPIIGYINKPGVVVGTDDFDCFIGRIRDVKINYGFVTNEDRVTIECEGIQADWGRAQLTNYALAENPTDDQVLYVGATVGLDTVQNFGRSTGSAQTYTGNAFELVNTITRTEEARMWADNYTHQGDFYLWWFGRNAPLATTYVFNDGTGTAYDLQMKYEQIEFRSSADNYYNSVTITPAGLAAQTATLATTPLYGWQKDTIDYTTSQALSHAQWVLNNFQDTDSTLAAITFTDVQQVPRPGGLFNTAVIELCKAPINTNGRVSFRSGTFNTIFEGVNISATPQQTRVTLYMSAQDNNAYLILDNTIFGVLDSNNKYGF